MPRTSSACNGERVLLRSESLNRSRACTRSPLWMRAAASSITEGLTGMAGVSLAAGTVSDAAGVDDAAMDVPIGAGDCEEGTEAVPVAATASGTAEAPAEAGVA